MRNKLGGGNGPVAPLGAYDLVTNIHIVGTIVWCGRTGGVFCVFFFCFSLALFKLVHCMREQRVSVPTNWVGEKWEGVHVWGDCCPAANQCWYKRRGGTCRENSLVAVTPSWCWGVGSRLGAEVVGLRPRAAAPLAQSGWSPTQHWPTVVRPRTHRRRTSQSPQSPLALPATKQ